MRNYILAIFVFIGMVAGIYLASSIKKVCPFKPLPATIQKQNMDVRMDEAFGLLKTRKDKDALVIFEKNLASHPDNQDALWGKAEVLRRSRNYKQAQDLLTEILKKNPRHSPALISLAYIKYKDNRLNEAANLVRCVLKTDCLDKENQASAYMMLGTINSKRSKEGWFFSKVAYGTQIKGYFLRAKELALDLPEVHLGLGTFYLLAPAIVGGDLNKAIGELELAVKIAPDFATANARLAQAYKKKGDLEKYNFYIRRTKELDPENEVLKELDINDK